MDQAKAPNLTHEQRKILNAKRVLMEVSPYEAAVVRQLRTMTFGQLIIHLLDSIPIRFTLGASYEINPAGDAELLKEVIRTDNLVKGAI